MPVPPKCPHPNRAESVNVVWHDKRHFADMIKGTDLEVERSSLDYLSGSNLLTWVLKIGGLFLAVVRKKERMAREGSHAPPLVLRYRGCVPGAEFCQQPHSVRERPSLRASRKEANSANVLILAWWDPNSDQQNCKVMQVHRIKPQSLRFFVIAATAN